MRRRRTRRRSASERRRGRCRAVALAIATAAAIAAVATLSACSSGTGTNRATAPTAVTVTTDPGPNPTGTGDPGPNPTAGGPDTVDGALTVIARGDSVCVQLAPLGSSRTYELQLPRGWDATAGTLAIDGRVVAHAGDDVFVTGRVTGVSGSCGSVVFAVDHLVSVVGSG